MVVDQIPSNVLVSNCATHVLDFNTCTEADLTSISIPLSLQVSNGRLAGSRACAGAAEGWHVQL